MPFQNSGALTTTSWLAVWGAGITDASKIPPRGDNVARFNVYATGRSISVIIEQLLPDGTTWAAIGVIDQAAQTLAATATALLATTADNAAGQTWLVPCQGLANVRLRSSVHPSGTVLVQANSYFAPDGPQQKI